MCKGEWCGCIVHKTCEVLLVAGGLNWGLVGLGMLMGSNLNVFNMILGSWPTAEAIVYLLVGIAAVMKLFRCKCPKCVTMCASCGTDDENKNM